MSDPRPAAPRSWPDRHWWYLLLALAGLAALALSVRLHATLDAAMTETLRNPTTLALYPWVAASDLLAAAILAVALLALLPRATEQADDWRSWARRPTLLAAILLVPTLFVGGPVAVAATAGAYAVLVWLARRLPDESRALFWLVAAAFALRLVVALVISTYGIARNSEPVLLSDEMAYHQAARQLSGIFRAGYGDLDFEWRHLDGIYLGGIGLLYVPFYDAFYLVRVGNAALGTLGALLAAAIAGRLWNRRAALTAGWLAALWPTLVLWGASGLREPLMIALALTLAWLLLAPRRAVSAAEWGLRLVVGLLLLRNLADVREHAAAAAFGALAIAALAVPVPWLGRRVRLLGAAALAALATLLIAVPALAPPAAASLMAQLSPRALEYRAAASVYTPLLGPETRSKRPPDPSFLPLGTAVRVRLPGWDAAQTGMTSWYETDPPRYQVLVGEGTTIDALPSQVEKLSDDNIGWLDVARRFGDGLALFFLPPLPWQVESLGRLGSIPDTLAWDALVAAALAAWWIVRDRRPTVVYLFAYVALMVVGLALASTNLGTLVRHRSTLVPSLLILAAPLLIRLVERVLARRRPVSTPEALTAEATVR